jgi:hypothetical protein
LWIEKHPKSQMVKDPDAKNIFSEAIETGRGKGK